MPTYTAGGSPDHLGNGLIDIWRSERRGCVCPKVHRYTRCSHLACFSKIAAQKACQSQRIAVGSWSADASS